jgi:hypothetical protein
MKHTITLTALIFGLASMVSFAQEGKYPPLSRYLMTRDAEIALAKSAAPASISGHATIKVFTKSGFEVANQGNNGFVCLVMRGFTGAPTFNPVQLRDAIAYDPDTLAPICLDPQAAKTVLPYYELRTRLAIQSKTPQQIGEAVRRAYENGEIPKRDAVSFATCGRLTKSLDPPGIGTRISWCTHRIMITL